MTRFLTLAISLLFSSAALIAQQNTNSTTNKSAPKYQPVQPIRPLVVVNRAIQQAPQTRPIVVSPVVVSRPAPAPIQRVTPPVRVTPSVTPIAGGIYASGTGRVSSTVIENAVQAVMRDANGLSHIFQNSGHQLSDLVNKLGGEENTIRSVLQQANGKFAKEGEIFKIDAKIEGEIVTVEGRMLNGVPRVSTMYIPPVE